MTTGERIRAKRKELGMSLGDLSARCMIDPSTLSKYEKGKYKITEAAILKLSAALQMDPESLKAETDEPADEKAPMASNQPKCKPGGVRWYSVNEKKPTLPCLILGQNTTLQIVTKRIISVETEEGTLYFNGLHGLREEDIKPGCAFRYWMPIPKIPTETQ